MSLKRSLSSESNINCSHDSIRLLKRLKLHSLIEELRNEEACLVLLKKLRTSQGLSKSKPTNHIKPVTNGFHSAEIRSTTPSINSAPSPMPNIKVQQLTVPVIPRKVSNVPLLSNPNPMAKSSSFEEYKTQAKLALRKQLERDLLNISSPKPSLQDIVFIPNGASLEFQPYIGLEDVVQCLSELQNVRHRLPQRYTDQAFTDEPYICDQCGTDFTIRWWKHMNSKLSNQTISILCDRCKKQVTRKAAKSEHSALLKNVFLSAMEQEKEIDRHFNALIKQQQQQVPSQLSSKPLASTNNRQTQSITAKPMNITSSNNKHQTVKNKTPVPQNLVPQISQSLVSTTNVTRKPNSMIQSGIHHTALKQHGHLPRTVQSNKIAMPVHYQQTYRTLTNVPQQTKSNQMVKMQKNVMKRQSIIPPSHSILAPNPELMNSLIAANLLRPTATKRSTIPIVEKK